MNTPRRTGLLAAVFLTAGSGVMPAQTTYYSTGNNSDINNVNNWNSERDGSGLAPVV